MLKGNLSTRPFYNERLVSAAITVVAVLAVGLTAYNVNQLVTLSSQRRDLATRISRDRGEAQLVRAHAATLQQTVDRAVINQLAGSTREANDIIDQRTFSWTAFFGLIEKTLPMDVRLLAVSPRVEKGVFKVEMSVIARDLPDVDTFIDALLATGAFYDVAPTDQQIKDDGTFSAAISAAYIPPQGSKPPNSTSASRSTR